jgi:hypothetical protein
MITHLGIISCSIQFSIVKNKKNVLKEITVLHVQGAAYVLQHLGFRP